MKLLSSNVTLIVVTLFLVACGRDEQSVSNPRPSDAIAQVGSSWITSADLEQAKKRFGVGDALRALEHVMDEEMYAQLAVREGLAEEPSVRAAVRSMLASRYLEKHLGPGKEVSEEAVRRVWEASEDRFVEPAKVHLAVVRQSFDHEREEVAKKNLREAAASYVDGDNQSFARLAARYSDHQDTRYQGGDCGWVSAGKGHALLPSEVIERATSQSEPGMSDGLVVSEQAVWLVLVKEVRASTRRPFESVSAIVRRELESESAQRARDELELGARDGVSREILDDALPTPNALAVAEPPSHP